MKPSPTLSEITRRVAHWYRIDHSLMLSKRRPEDIVFPRQVAMFLARKILRLSYPRIGELFNNRDHSTVMWACRRVSARIDTERDVKQSIEDLENSFAVN